MSEQVNNKNISCLNSLKIKIISKTMSGLHGAATHRQRLWDEVEHTTLTQHRRCMDATDKSSCRVNIWSQYRRQSSTWLMNVMFSCPHLSFRKLWLLIQVCVKNLLTDLHLVASLYV